MEFVGLGEAEMQAESAAPGVKLNSLQNWPSRRDLPPLTSACPALPRELVPRALYPWVEDVAANLGVQPEFIAIPALGFLAITVGCKVGIRPKQFDSGWLVVTSVLWVALIASSGRKKSPAINTAQEPLARIERRESEAYIEKSKETRAARAAVDAKIEGVKSKIKDLGKAGKSHTEQVQQLDDLIADQERLKLIQKRYTTHDATIEKLGMLLGENPNGMGLVADELMGWMRGLEKSGYEEARAFFLKGWGGTAPNIVDRVGRGTTTVKRLSLTVVGGIQPEVFQEYVAEVLKGGRDADGLLARFQLAITPDPSERLPLVDKIPNVAACKQVNAIFEALDALTPAQLGLQQDGDEIPSAKFDEVSQNVFNIFLSALDDKLLASDIVPALQSHLAKYRSTMPALALLFELVNWAASLDKNQVGSEASEVPKVFSVGLESTTQAALLCDWLEVHARAIYGGVANRELKAAHVLAKKIRAGAVVDGSTIRQIHRNCWSGLTDRASLQAAVEILEDHNWLTIVDDKGPTGRSSSRILLHPDLQPRQNGRSEDPL
jgi:hypothetical protein